MNSMDSSMKKSNLSLNEDFWAELDSVSESGVDVGQDYHELDDNYSPNKSLEDLAEADWLREAGLQDIIHSLKDDCYGSGSTSLDDLLANSLSIPLTERQTKTVRKRYNTLRSAIVKQKGYNGKRGQEVVQIVNSSKQRPDVRSLFTYTDNNYSNTTTNTNNGTDSACLVQQIEPIINRDISESDGMHLSTQNSYTLDVPTDGRQPRRGSSPDLLKVSAQRQRTSSTSSEMDNEGDLMKFKTKPHLQNLSKSATNIKKESSSRFSWTSYKKAFRLTSDRKNPHSLLDTENTETGIEALSLKYKSSLRGPEDRSHFHLNAKPSVDTFGSEYFNNDEHITAQGLGIEVIINPQSPYASTELRLNSYVCRLEELNVDMRKKVKTLAMIELSTVLDMYELEFEKLKLKKSKKRIKKNSDNILFGVPLIDLHNTDLRRNSSCTFPLILNILFNYIRKNGLHEEGIFRINGSQNRVIILKQELGRLFQTLYNNSISETDCIDKVFTILNDYSIYDICSLLKQLIRELPDPLLTQELLEAFLLVPKITDFLQQIQVLNLLILLIDESHRNTLEAILYLFNDIINHEHLNKMSAQNVATIMAPNLFPVLAEKKRLPKQHQPMDGLKEMEYIMERAKDSFHITKTLVYNYGVLFHVPPYLIAQIQRRKK